MTCGIQSAGTIELYFYGELSADDHAAIEAHVKSCVVCRQAHDDLSMIRAALAARPDVATPPGADWSAFMARLDRATHSAQADERLERASPIARVLAMPLRRRAIAYATIAALLALVTMVVLTVVRGRQAVTVDEPARPIAASVRRLGPESPSAAIGRDPALVSISGAHFERSKLVILELATKETTDLRADDWSRGRELAAALLNDTRLYRAAAEDRGMTTLAGVMRDLELVLLQTSMSQEPDASSLEQLQRLIRRRDLLTKMNMVATSGP